ncbi:hypothetical protein D3C76_879320 [compost metagenome]
MAARQAFAGNPVNAVGMALDPLVVRVGAERAAAMADEIQRPLPLAVAQLTEGPGAAHLFEQRFGAKAAA